MGCRCCASSSCREKNETIERLNICSKASRSNPSGSEQMSSVPNQASTVMMVRMRQLHGVMNELPARMPLRQHVIDGASHLTWTLDEAASRAHVASILVIVAGMQDGDSDEARAGENASGAFVVSQAAACAMRDDDQRQRTRCTLAVSAAPLGYQILSSRGWSPLCSCVMTVSMPSAWPVPVEHRAAAARRAASRCVVVARILLNVRSEAISPPHRRRCADRTARRSVRRNAHLRLHVPTAAASDPRSRTTCHVWSRYAPHA